MVKVKRTYLFIEGTSDTANGDLKAGFGHLLEKKLKGRMPTLDMGEGKTQTIRKFLASANSKLLCDLDGPESTRGSDLSKYKLSAHRAQVFYMIEEMEAWFISQPTILDQFYKTDVSKKLAKKPASEFREPDKELQKITKDTQRGSYQKVKHGIQLLAALDPEKLMQDFPDFKRLVESFSKD